MDPPARADDAAGHNVAGGEVDEESEVELNLGYKKWRFNFGGDLGGCKNAKDVADEFRKSLRQQPHCVHMGFGDSNPVLHASITSLAPLPWSLASPSS